MTATAHTHWQEQEDEPAISVEGRVNPGLEDAYWHTVYWGEPYHRTELHYEDYAAAYCVGYVGRAQYGDPFVDAEKSLIANWLRIKGDSRLTLDEGIQAIRAAWDHAERTQQRLEDDLLGAQSRPARRFTPASRPASHTAYA